MDLAAAQMSVVRQMTERLAREVPVISARELPSGIRNMTIAAAVHTDKAQLLRGSPTQRVELGFEEAKRALARHGVKIYLAGEARTRS